MKYFFKANNDVISHCACENEPALGTAQMECPWCGCGWLISCSKCNKAFTFAEVRETDLTMEDMAQRESNARSGIELSQSEFAAWSTATTETLNVFEVGDVVVYIDGAYWTIDAEEIEFEGYYAAHKFERLPHADAIANPQMLNQMLGDPGYWYDRAIENE